MIKLLRILSLLFITTCLSAPANAVVLRLDLVSQINFITPGSPLDSPSAPFQIGDAVTLTMFYDTEATDMNSGGGEGFYEFISVTSTWGDYTFTATPPISPAPFTTGFSLRDQPPDSITSQDQFRILDEAPSEGGGLSAAAVGGLELMIMEFTFFDFDGTALTSEGPPLSLDFSDFEVQIGNLFFGPDFANVSIGPVDGTITVVPIPAASWLLLTALAGLAGLRRRY